MPIGAEIMDSWSSDRTHIEMGTYLPVGADTLPPAASAAVGFEGEAALRGAPVEGDAALRRFEGACSPTELGPGLLGAGFWSAFEGVTNALVAETACSNMASANGMNFVVTTLPLFSSGCFPNNS
jgi:hypothetical protein